jgi:PiT family inorganic phosphate transporter
VPFASGSSGVRLRLLPSRDGPHHVPRGCRHRQAWLVTLPAAALVGGVSASVVKHGGDFGTAVIALVAAAVALFIVVAAPRNPVDARNVNDHHEVSIRTAAPTGVGTAA